MKPARFLLSSSVFVVLLAMLSAFCTRFAGPGALAAEAKISTADTPLVDEKVRQAMQDRDYPAAISAIDEAMKAKDAARDYLTYLKGRALYLSGKHDEAVAQFDLLAKEFPKSEWSRRARFAKAVALARKGDFRAAELIYRAEAEYLLSNDRKQEIAGIYLEFADLYFKPPKEEQKPDYQKALEFYKKALEVGPKPEKRVEVELLVAECLQKLGKHGEAAALYEKFSKDHPTSPLDIEARYRLGECRLAEGNRKEARRVWQDLLAKYPESQSARIADAQFNLSRTWSIPQPNNDEELSLGTAALEAFIERFPKHKLASQAHLEIAQSFMHRGRFEDAVTALKRFLADPRYQDRTELPDGQNLLGRCYQLQKKFTEAIVAWQDFLKKYPAHKAWSDVQRQIIETEYLMAVEKAKAKQYDEANKLFAEFLQKYPLDPRNPQILLLMNGKNVAEEKWDEAIAEWRRLVSKYPGTNEASQAQYLVGQTLEKKLAKLEEALEEYKKVTWGPFQGEARQAIARLTAKTMNVATERVFRTDETPRLKLITRNIESVTVRAYKVDLETYFRKMHLARGVEGLDITLIDPDKTFEFTVPKYAKYQELESWIEVPLPADAKAGVMAVTVSSKTLEATTMVLQSDLDVVVKSSRDEVFVFAENMLTGKPWPGVKLLISNGKEVIGEGTTGKDGVFQKSYKQLGGGALLPPGPEPGVQSAEPAEPAEPNPAANEPVPQPAPVQTPAGPPPAPPAEDPFSSSAPSEDLFAEPAATPPPATTTPPTVNPAPLAPPGFAPNSGPPTPPSVAPVANQPNPPPTQPVPRVPTTNAVPSSPGAAPAQPVPVLPLQSLAPNVEPRRGPLEANDVRVFAVIDGSVASNLVALRGVGVARGLADKGYVYTDRPAYRPGQLVNVRGVLRHAVDDAYTIEKDKPYTVEVFDSRNRLVRQEKVKLNGFGSFHTHFVLPPSSPQGPYRVLVRDNNSQNYQGTFQVHEYQLEPVRLTVDTPRRVYYRGEPIEGTIRAEFYYGAPLVGREVRYQLADDRQQTATTDAKGEIRFKLQTREFSETQIVPLMIQLPERGMQTAVNFVLAARGFAINVSTVRPVYVAGETFEATIKTTDAEGKPTAQKLKLKVLEQTTVEGKVGERFVEEFPLETAADGAARKTVKLDKGGQYILRAEGVDRFKNPITGDLLVQVSDEEDRVRLRILADKHTFKVGDQAAVNLHWREDPALCLVTFQGARVLDYRLVELKKGDNKLELPMTAVLAPNFELAVAVMTDPRPDLKEKAEAKPQADVKPEAKPETPKPEAGAKPAAEAKPKPETKKPIIRFHAASSPFTVQRDLKVKIVAKRKVEGPAKPEAKDSPVRPGDELEVTITTTDPQGRPVAAEVSLAMIEQSLLERFPGALATIQDFFRGEYRQTAVRTTASITFSYRPSTQAINPRLLAEADRMEVLKEEEESRRSAIVAAGEPASDAPAAVADPFAPLPSLEEVAEAFEQNREMLIEEDGNGGTTVQRHMQTLGGRSSGSRSAGAQQLAQNLVRQQGQAFTGIANAPANELGRVSLGYQYTRDLGQGEFNNADFQVAGGGLVLGDNNTYTGGTQINDGTLSISNAATLNPNSVLLFNGGNAYSGATNLNADNLNTLVAQNYRQVIVVDKSGSFRNVKLHDNGNWDQRRAEALAAEFNQSGAILLSALVPQETGYWNPAIATDEKGNATVSFVVPERSTAWKLLAKGVTTETLAGETTDTLAVKKDLFGELKLPLAFTDGDEAEITASVHNEAVEKGQIEVILKTTIGGKTVEEKKTIDVKEKGLHELSFKAAMNRPEVAKDDKGEGTATPEIAADFELIVKSGERQDALRASVPLAPYGMPVFATASGSATSATTAWVEPPQKMPLERPSLQIVVGPTVERSLLDIVLGPAPWCQLEMGRIASGLESGTSDLMASLGLQKLLGGSREAGSPEAQALDGRIRAAISLLVSSQNDDGGWSWTGSAGAGNRYASCRVVWALTLAKGAGYTVPEDSYNKALAFLRTQVAATDNADYESKAMLLHALSVAGQGDFALANRLYRDRPALSNAALAHLALGFAAMDRKATAEELLALLAERNLDDATSRRESAKGTLPWSGSSVELRALYALALQDVSPKSPKAKDLVDWLMAHRTGHRWAPDKATGPAALALTRYFADTRFAGEHYKLTVFVNDVQVKVLDIDQNAQSELIEVPSKLLALAKGKQRINFQITGRGRYTYQCILGGFVPADKLAGTTQDWKVERFHEPAALELDGKEIPRGFGVLEGSFQTFRNPLSQLPVGRRGTVELSVWRPNVSHDTPDERLEYLVITEPIPAGTTVIEKSVRGPFERFEIGASQITFYVGNRKSVGSIHYELYGYLPGKYRAAPTVIRNAHRPDQFVISGPKALEVLPLGATSKDPYRLTPQELHELGKRLFEKKDFKAAMGHLSELVEKWNLRAEVYKDAVQRLLDIHLELGPPAKVVHYFEIIKEKWPAEAIPFDKIVKVGAAYHEMGEYERSYLVFRATVESSFGVESGVAGFLQAQGEFPRSVEVMGRILREYPPEGYVAAATYALAQQVYAKAPEAANDRKLREQKVNRVDLIRRAWTMLEGFLTAYPDDPAADQAAFATASTLLDLKAYKEAAAACSRYAKRYEKSDLLDGYWYMIGYCEYATGQHKAALEMCRKVAELKRTDKTGREVESPNKWRAIYILGQIYHSLGEAAQAIGEYRRVEDRFADAKEAIAYFLRKAIELPEVSTAKPGEPAEVELKFRNVPAVDVKVYRIDLMKFSLLNRNLAGIAQINLAGIRPLYETTVKLGDGKDYRDRTHKLPLPLKDEGAYLVVCRGDDLHASGLVLVTPLALEIQEDAASGRVRTTVKQRTKDAAAPAAKDAETTPGSYVGNVHVKVIGSRNEDFVSGATDLRGVFVADGIRGKSTVIARLEPSRYAFFRGQAELGPVPPPTPVAAPAPTVQLPGSSAKPAAPQSLEGQLLEGLQEQNRSNQSKQIEQLDKMYKAAPSKGVEAKDAF